MSHRTPKQDARRRGNAAVTAIAIIPIMGFLALTVDVSVLQTSHSQLQIAVDAAALAGSGYLDGTAAGMETARKKAVAMAAMNNVLGQPVQLAETDVHIGTWNTKEQRFTTSNDPKLVDAVYVEMDVSDIGTLFASAAFGSQFMTTSASSIARAIPNSGSGRVDCYLPVAIPHCFLTKEDVQIYPVKMSSAQNDNAGWSEVNGNASANAVVSQLRGNCSGGAATVDDRVGLNNGEMTTAFQEVRSQIMNSTTYWDATRWGPIRPPMNGNATGDPGSHSTIPTAHYGKVIEGPVIIFEPRSGTCGSSTQFNQDAEIVGFAWGIIYDVDSQGSGKTLRMQLDLTYDHNVGEGGGGVATNIMYTEYGLVH